MYGEKHSCQHRQCENCTDDGFDVQYRVSTVMPVAVSLLLDGVSQFLNAMDDVGELLWIVECEARATAGEID